jgi:hypothetical protein
MMDKAIKSGKEHRKEYRKAKAISMQCRNHGSCIYCLNNRLHKYKIKELSTNQQLKDFKK